MSDNFKLQFKRREPFGIQSTIMMALMGVTFSIALLIGIVIYSRYVQSSQQVSLQNTASMIQRTAENLEYTLLDMRHISDAVNYNVIQEDDVSDSAFITSLNLLYETNNDKILTIALYDKNGKLISAEPVTKEKNDADVKSQPWFENAENEIENVHFSTPHIENLFVNSTGKFHWVISLSRSVDITKGGVPENGILLVDMNYSGVSDIMEQINDTENGQYYYLIDGNGNIIYHPKAEEISRGIFSENPQKAASYEDGVYTEKQNGEKRKVVVQTISYTGWKLVGVIPKSATEANTSKFQYFVLAASAVFIMMLLVVNRIIANRISRPIRKLSDSVKDYGAGEKPDIYIGGSTEIRHLGSSVQKSYEEIERLMKEIVEQQNQRRKSELAALQSQINPHFLYNTLDSITWMIEGGKNEGAVTMISELAKLLRISLSKGRTIIPVQQEIQHSKSYMNIQKVRYKDKFEVEFDIDSEIDNYCTVKLIIQPILENAIYYGVGDMDPDDGGKILVKGRMRNGDIYIEVIDNGMGMTEETAKNVLTDNEKVQKRGSGVGLVNVHNRIQIMFGTEYGLIIKSEPDEGTTVTVHLPAILYNDDNVKAIEDAKVQKDIISEKEN